MSESNPNALERPLFAICIHTQRHRRTCTETCEQEIVRRQPGISSTNRLGLIAIELVGARLDHLRETGLASYNENLTRLSFFRKCKLAHLFLRKLKSASVAFFELRNQINHSTPMAR